MISLPSYKWRVPETCGLKLSPPELLEDLVINPCPVSTSQSSFITIPVRCGSSYLGRVFFSSGRNTLHIVRWSTSLRCAHTNLHCPMSATQCNTFLWHTVSQQQVIFGEVGVMFGTRALCGHLGIWAVSSIQPSAVFNTQQYSQMFLQQGDRPSGNNMHLLASVHLGTNVTLTTCADPVPWVLCCQHACHTRAS